MKQHILAALLLCLALFLPALAATEDAKPMMDIVWVVDCTGSMPYSIQGVTAQMASFASKLTDFDVQYGLVGFGDELNDVSPRESTVTIQWDGSDWTSDISVLQNSMASGLPSYRGGDKEETPTSGLYMAAAQYAWRENAVHAIVLVADNAYKTQGTSLVTGKAIPSMQECLDACGEKNISINLMNCGTTAAYDNAVSQSGGIVGRYSDGWTTAVEQIAQWIHDAPVVITQPEDQYVHEGYRVVFEAASHPVKECIFEWYHLLNGRTTSSYVGLSPKYRPRDFVSDASKQMDGMEVYCRFSNFTRYDKRSIETRHVRLRVASKFAITQQPQPQFVDVGQTATFTVVATGDDLTYQWQKQSGDTWVDLSGETVAALSILATLADDDSVYRCVIKDAISGKQPDGYTLTSDPAALTVVAAPVITADPQDVTTEAGKTASFTVTATGEGLTYQWQQQVDGGWADLSGETGTTLTVSATPENSGSVYRCQVTSGNGTVVVSQSAALTVEGAPSITTDPQNIRTEAGKTAVFTVAATGNKLTYQWQQQVDGGWADMPGETGATLTVSATPENSGSVYRCQVTSGYGTVVESQPAALAVDGAPAITADPQNVTTEAGKTAVFTVTATGEGLTYQWQQQVDGGWADMPGETGATLTVSATPENSGSVYRCRVTSGYGTVVESQSAALTVEGAPAITADPQNVTTEAGKTAVFTVAATGEGLTYQWQQQVDGGWADMPGETGATLTVSATPENSGSVYRCRVTSGYGTVVESQSAALTVDGAPVITGQPQDVTTEAGKTAVFTVTATGEGLTYQWQQQVDGGWADMPGETGTTLTVSATPENSGSVYRCQVTSGYDTVVESQPAALAVDGAPVITGQPEGVIVMEGEDVSITIAATGEGLKYQWQVYSSGAWMNCADGQTPTLTLRSLSLKADGQTYRCVITSSYGTTVTSDTVTLTVLAQVELPQTGDASRLWLWLTLLGASLLGLAVHWRRRA